MRLRSEPQQQSEADKTKVTFTTEADNKKLKFMCKPKLTSFQTEPAVKLRPRSTTDSIRRSAVILKTLSSLLEIFNENVQ